MTTDVEDLRTRIERLPPLKVDWFLDIDGVINIIGNRPRGGWPRYENVVIPVGIEGLGWQVCFAPALVELMNLLHQRRVVSFRWLTTWEHDGPRLFAPAVGLTLGSWVAGEDHGGTDTWWKLDIIIDHLNDSGRVFIWTDDDMRDNRVVTQRDQGIIDMLPARVLALCTDSRKGLTPENFHTIVATLEEMAWA